MISKWFWIIFIVLNSSESTSTMFKEKTSMKTYSIVDLIENSPLNTRILTFDDQWKSEKNKIILLNLNGFEKEMFSIVNGTVLTSSSIDREEMIEKKRCLDPLYCLIELHFIVNDAAEYWIVPIHIVDENDNGAKFYQSEIELKFNEKIVNGYQIPFVGAKDVDEGTNGEIFYFLDCSTSIEIPMENQTFNTNNQTKSLSKNCFPLFELLILSQSSSSSSSNHFDQLALKYRPSRKFPSSKTEFILILYAMDRNSNGNRRETSMKIVVKIDEKDKFVKFSLSSYEFVLTLNETSNEQRIHVGRVYAMTNDPSERIHYKLISTNVQNRKIENLIEINSLTGEIYLQRGNLSKLIDEIQCEVQGSILFNRKSFENVRIKIYLRYIDLLSQISFEFENLSKNSLKMFEKNSSSNVSFVLDENFDKNQTNLFQITIRSNYYPFDRYLLSLENNQKSFSIVSSSTSSNNVYQFQRKTFQNFAEENLYEFQFSIKHQLSQHVLSFLYVRLFLTNSLITTTTTIVDEIETSTESIFRPEIETNDWCVENNEFILFDLEPVGHLKVIRSMRKTPMNSSSIDESILLIKKFNENELIIDECQMSFQSESSVQFNRSTFLQLCSSSSMKTFRCFNVTTFDFNASKSIDQQNEFDEQFLSIRSIEIVISIISIVFLFVSIVLIFIICRLKGLNLFKTVQNYFYDHKYSFKRTSRISSIKRTMDKINPRIIDVQCRSSSFLSPKIKTISNETEIYDVDQHLWEQQGFSSATLFLSSSISNDHLPALLFNPTNSQIVYNHKNEFGRSSPPPPPPSTRSSMTTTSSSFLRETKQLLDLISTNYQTNESKLISEV